MTKAPKNWRNLGYLIPDVIDPEENICVCVPVPKDWGHIRAFLGQMTELSKWLTWEKDGTDSAKRAAARWFEITQCVAEEIDCIMATGCGCSGKAVTNTRINPDTGVYEVSYDNGETWIPDPANDPRASGTVFPPLAGADGATKRCNAANSIVGFFEEMQQTEYNQLVANKTVAEIFAVIVGVLTTLGIVTLGLASAVGAIIAFVVGLFAHMIPEDFNSQFTNSTWADLLCLAYCNMNDDGSINEAQWNTIKDACAADIGGYAGTWLKEHINLIGVVGLTNAARSNYPGSRDCGSCDCGACQYRVSFDGLNLTDYVVEYGTVALNRLNVVPHEYPLGSGTGASVRVNFPSPCSFRHVAVDTQFSNTRQFNDCDICFDFYDASDVSIGVSCMYVRSEGGLQQHVEQSALVDDATYCKVTIAWINTGEPNTGWIDNLSFNYG